MSGYGAGLVGVTQPPAPAGCASPFGPTWAEITYPVASPVVTSWAGGTTLSPTDPPAFDTDVYRGVDLTAPGPGGTFAGATITG